MLSIDKTALTYSANLPIFLTDRIYDYGLGKEQRISRKNTTRQHNSLLVCLGGYAIPVDALHATYDSFRADIFGFTFFSLFIASTVLLTFEQDDASEESAPE